ncbi:hypothetical protein BH23ACT5_BH23ACT5_09310 [soil metagenome]
MVEYAFVLVLISLVAVASVQYFGGSVAGEYQNAADAMDGQSEPGDSTTTTVPDTTTTLAPSTTTTVPPTTTTVPPTTTTTMPPTTTTMAPTTTTTKPPTTTTTTLPCVPRGQSNNCK